MAQRKLPTAPGSIGSSTAKSTLHSSGINGGVRYKRAEQPKGLPDWLAGAEIPTREQRIQDLRERDWKPFAPPPGTEANWDLGSDGGGFTPETVDWLTEGREPLDVPLDLVPPPKPKGDPKEKIEDLLSGNGSGKTGGVVTEYTDRGTMAPRSPAQDPKLTTPSTPKENLDTILSADPDRLKEVLKPKTVSVPDVFDSTAKTATPSKQLSASELLAGVKNSKPVTPGTSILGGTSSTAKTSDYSAPIEKLYNPDAKRALKALGLL